MTEVDLYALLVAIAAAWGTVHVARRMTFEGVGGSDGGGWAALLVIGVGVFIAAAAVALPVS